MAGQELGILELLKDGAATGDWRDSLGLSFFWAKRDPKGSNRCFGPLRLSIELFFGLNLVFLCAF